MLPMLEHQQIQQSKKPDIIFRKPVTSVSQNHVTNPVSIVRAKINPKSLTHADIMQLQRTIGNRAVGRLLSGIGNTSTDQQMPVQRQEIPEEEEPLQGKMAETIQCQELPDEEEPLQGKFERKFELAACPSCSIAPIQKEEENRTGMPDNLKAGVERLSGLNMSDVRVHYNSSKPAEIGALAYTQGATIHVAPGQENHLPHEAWHVVQQAQGRVQPTLQMKDGTAINNDEGLENEADEMGRWAAKANFDGLSINSTVGETFENVGQLKSQGVAQLASLKRRALGRQEFLKWGVDEQEHENGLGVFHEHIFFDDDKEPSNIGFGPHGLFHEESDDGYTLVGPFLSDKYMRLSVHLNKNPGEYNIVGNNCQKWAKKVIDDYYKLLDLGPHSKADKDLEMQELGPHPRRPNIEAVKNAGSEIEMQDFT
jgi:hypothetical protein